MTTNNRNGSKPDKERRVATMTNDQKILVEENVTFAFWKANSWSKTQKTLDKDELDGICLEALTMAAISYDGQQSAFATYASNGIDKAVMAAIRAENRQTDLTYRVRIDEDADSLNRMENATDVREALELIPPLHKAVLVAYHTEGYSRREIAEQYGIKEHQVTTIIREAGTVVARECR